ncbi:hypothetical protein OG897_35610 [Streptomyces sp. NBC_00237]|uniref:hypothetical protein n=1 Tax=Streptomyces sp. NBC_00237 TaxID=2975687 RepID=UPI002257BA8E|nr:hypothetical protein [Streptomyces sp. NBC_00237]MCX5206719.1 hypothetical protein [Streptomyces sp. NBC_00237]
MDADGIAQRFPLVARPRPVCATLAARIREVSTLAEAARHDGGLSSGAAALNRAALIASDCGLPGLARDLCWTHADLYLNAPPLTGQTARYALEPLVNLARLLIRDGQGLKGYQLLTGLYEAVRNRQIATIASRSVSFEALTATADEHRQVCEWLWTVLLGDGTRALVKDRLWSEARAHATECRGIGKRLLDGRQVVVVSACLGGYPDRALRVLRQTHLGEEWEGPVNACLTTLCLALAEEPTAAAEAAMVEQYLALDGEPELAVFRARVGLTVLALAPNAGAHVVARLVNDATTAQDGYVARDVLATKSYSPVVTDRERRGLTSVVVSAGLDLGHLPTALADLLDAAVCTAATAIQHHLALRRLVGG